MEPKPANVSSVHAPSGTETVVRTLCEGDNAVIVNVPEKAYANKSTDATGDEKSISVTTGGPPEAVSVMFKAPAPEYVKPVVQRTKAGAVEL